MKDTKAVVYGGVPGDVITGTDELRIKTERIKQHI
jgi:hypothetical protein